MPDPLCSTMIEVNIEEARINGALILHDIRCNVIRGDFLGIIGPNGAGKSTLLRVLSRLHIWYHGNISLEGRDIRFFPRKQLAQIIAVLPAELHIPFDFTVSEIVYMGRRPHAHPSPGFAAHDDRIVTESMEATDTLQFAERNIHSLSSGEKQRVLIAQAIAQEPDILLLDEPTAHLDINHQKEIMDMLNRLNQEKSLTIVMVSHDINCAAEYCSRLILLKQGSIVCQGTVEEALTLNHMNDLYAMPVHVGLNPVTGKPHVYMIPHNNKNEEET